MKCTLKKVKLKIFVVEVCANPLRLKRFLLFGHTLITQVHGSRLKDDEYRPV